MVSHPRKGVLVRVLMVAVGNYGISMNSGYIRTVSEMSAPRLVEHQFVIDSLARIMRACREISLTVP